MASCASGNPLDRAVGAGAGERWRRTSRRHRPRISVREAAGSTRKRFRDVTTGPTPSPCGRPSPLAAGLTPERPDGTPRQRRATLRHFGSRNCQNPADRRPRVERRKSAKRFMGPETWVGRVAPRPRSLSSWSGPSRQGRRSTSAREKSRFALSRLPPLPVGRPVCGEGEGSPGGASFAPVQLRFDRLEKADPNRDRSATTPRTPLRLP